MSILPAHLIFHEIVGLMNFADVVIIAGDAAEEGIGLDGVGGRFGEGRDAVAVVVRSGRFQRQPPQQGMAGIGQFQQGHARGDAECLFDEGKNSQHDESRGEPGRADIKAVLGNELGRFHFDGADGGGRHDHRQAGVCADLNQLDAVSQFIE